MRSKALKWKLPLIALVIAGSFALVTPPFDTDGSGPQTGKLKLGLDLQGGMHLVLRVKTEALPPEQREDATERALEVMRNRIDQFGVSEPMIQRQGEDQIVLQLPGIADRERALELIGRTALLEFKLVSDAYPTSDIKQESLPIGLKAFPQKEGGFVVLEDTSLLKGNLIVGAQRGFESQWGDNVVSITFNSEGATTFGNITSANVKKRLAITLDDVVVSAPVIQEAIYGGQAQITGSFTIPEADDLAIALRAGALPAPIQIEEERTIGPTLGKDSIRRGVSSTIYAGIFVLIFMAVYYLYSGLIANLALLLNIILIGGALAYFRGTLTLPGIAGVILTIGMAVDTNVLILERIREELRLGKEAQAAIATGYKKAFSAILDSNVTTFLTALVLFYLGTGPVRGFALTLMIGIVGSFFSGLFVTRTIYDLTASVCNFKRIPMLTLLKGVPTFPFMKVRNIMFVISMIGLAASMVTFVLKGSDHLGIDFTGGTIQEFRFTKTVPVSDIRNALTAVNLDKASIQTFGDNNDIIVRSLQGTEDAVNSTLKSVFSAEGVERIRVESVGPIVGKELRRKALLAVLGSLAIILGYLSFRFRFYYSIGAIIAVFHDAIICLAFTIWSGRELSVAALAAVLTIVGYSVNDTIVIFDRVRENVRKGTKESFVDVMNRSYNESLSRTILTSFTTLIVVVALYLFGGPVINDFAYIMIVGIIAGTYSTIYIACPVAIFFQKRRKLGSSS